MGSKGIASAISELGEIISILRETVKVKDWQIDKLNEEITSKDARIKELEDVLSKRPEYEELTKWNK